ncbi:MAG: hypothetical protein GWN84_22955, partial [Gammaproteobacteria bacterium]|nr:hypothetical protein [Gammaproteobacteria bacterium]NIR85469.1 hypothetical protein [Gammaproteobacteria bacterium]NIR89521.1 hypothetical protein [Gammaproteobacteria bacterium]NIU06606.1 hypothetical protein [Gammaproteobacteria bacterium]NIV53489.1 hypothetical protein [Gammaproteobacteria bacterium]
MTEAADIPVPDAAGVSSTLSLRLYPSARLTLVLTAVHVGALVCLLQVELAPMLDGVL